MNETNRSDAESAADAAPPEGDPALAAALAKAQDNWNSYLRAVAEFENFRKRTDREIDNARKYAVERFAQDIVTVADALEAAVSSAAGGPDAAHLEGAQATLRQLHRAFDKAGIALLDPAGKPFDPEWHEAMVAVDRADVPPNTVVNVVQKGYTLNGRLLRPARVVVSRTPANGAAQGTD